MNKKPTNKFFMFILDCISFNKPKAIVFNLSSVLVALAAIPQSYLSSSPVKCIFKTIGEYAFHGHCPASGFLAGCNCPACGLTRGMSSLLHGRLHEAIAYNPLVLPLFLTMIVLIVINLIRMKRQAIF